MNKSDSSMKEYLKKNVVKQVDGMGEKWWSEQWIMLLSKKCVYVVVIFLKVFRNLMIFFFF